jgi:hypothetical protein
MMVDFSPADVRKVCKAGYEAKRAASGTIENDKAEFCLPFAEQDVEILFACVAKDTFNSIHEKKRYKKAAIDSVEPQMRFERYTEEIMKKAGWLICFLAPETEPKDLQDLGVHQLGVDNSRKPYKPFTPGSHHMAFPKYVGQGAHLKDNSLVASVLGRFIKSAHLRILSCPHEHGGLFSPLSVVGQHETAWFSMWDTGSVPYALALEVELRRKSQSGKILILPDFGDKNASVALALLQEVIPLESPHLFDAPQHSWLDKYEPAPVMALQKKRLSALQCAANLEKQAGVEREKYNWLLGLLVSSGDEFAANAAHALRFLGFEVEDMDEELAPGQRRREDLRIRDEATGYFALGEAKTTGKGRGASEEFISKTQNHQTRYSREERVPAPPAWLIANFAINLEPVQRTALFYQPEVAGRLEDSGITAISSVALFDLCQWVLAEEVTKEQARRFLMQGQPMINTTSVEEVNST